MLVESDCGCNTGYAGSDTDNAKTPSKIIDWPAIDFRWIVGVVKLAWIHHGGRLCVAFLSFAASAWEN